MESLITNIKFFVRTNDKNTKTKVRRTNYKRQKCHVSKNNNNAVEISDFFGTPKMANCRSAQCILGGSKSLTIMID